MKPITLRNMPSRVAQAVRKRAKQHRTSLNRAVIDLLDEAIAGKPGLQGRVDRRDLDHLAGTWSKDEAEDFDRALAEQRSIDPALWR